MEEKDYIFFDVRDSHKFPRHKESQWHWEIKPSFDLERENGKIIYGRELSYLGSGENSTVWKYEQDSKKYAVKIFLLGGLMYALDLDVYWKMKKIPLKNTLKALEILKVINDGVGAKTRQYYAYIMEYLEEQKNYSIVDMPTSMLLENASILESDAKLLAQNNIVMRDGKMENSIFNKANSMLYISDIDMFEIRHVDIFSKERISCEELISCNYVELQYIFYDFLIQYSSEHYNSVYNALFITLFLLDNTHEKTITEKLEDLFSPYDTPKQFFEDNKSSYDKKYLKK